MSIQRQQVLFHLIFSNCYLNNITHSKIKDQTTWVLEEDIILLIRIILEVCLMKKQLKIIIKKEKSHA